jgi:WD40 repeat protein
VTSSSTFRVFVSSTFDDLKVERNLLQQHVFPAVERLCRSLNARFQPIDLRWGVRDEAALDHRTVEICLSEVERCTRTGLRPHFIILLGERYGWQPVPAQIEADEFAAICEHVADRGALAFLQQWYQLDRNGVPPHQLLKRRAQALADPSAWSPIEGRLRKVLRDAAHAAGFNALQLLKYDCSATHLEILKGLEGGKAATEHVFAFFRESDAPLDPRLRELQAYLRDVLPKQNICPFRAGDHARLRSDVERCLSEVIQKEAGRITSVAEAEAHDLFAARRFLRFFGRTEVLAQLEGYLHDADSRTLILHGPGGSGKSALMSRASDRTDVIRRFVGATPASSTTEGVVRGLCAALSNRFDLDDELPADFETLKQVFLDRLALARADQPVTVFVDALDQLHDSNAGVDWLPVELPPHCKLVVSTIDVPRSMRAARLVHVPHFSTADANATLDAWLADAKRTLPDWQRTVVMEAFAVTGLPLHLRLAFEEARFWRSFDQPIDCVINPDVDGVIDRMFDRLAMDANHGRVLVEHTLGYMAAGRYGLAEDEVLDVLTRDDAVWEDVIGRGRSRRHDLPARRLPSIIWSRLYLDLSPFLYERPVAGGLTITFCHRAIEERVVRRFLAGASAKDRHELIACFFAGQPSEQRHPVGRAFNYADVIAFNHRKLDELPYQFAMSKQRDAMDGLLSDLDFLDAKARSGRIRDLIDDYRMADSLYDDPLAPRSLSDFRRFVQREANVIERYGKTHPQMFFQQAFNQAKTGPLHDACARKLESGEGPQGYWFERVNRPSGLGTQACVMSGELSGPTYAVAASPDCGMVAASTARGTITLLSATTGAKLRELEGHQQAASVFAWTSRGDLVSASWDGTIRVWNAHAGHCLLTLGDGVSPVTCLQLVDDTTCVAGGMDGVVRVWNIADGSLRRRTRVASGPIVGAISDATAQIVAASEDGALVLLPASADAPPRSLRETQSPITSLTVAGPTAAVGLERGDIEVLNLATGQLESVLTGHTGPIAGAAMDNSGQWWSWSFDFTIRGWSRDGKCVAVLRDHDSAVTHGTLRQETLITGSQDGTVRVFDLAARACVAVLRGHKGWITCLADSQAGIVSGSWNGSIRLWDLREAVSGGATETADAPPTVDEEVFAAVIRDERTALTMSKRPDKVQVWDLATGACVKTIYGGGPETQEFYRRMTEMVGHLWSYCGADPFGDWHHAIGAKGITEEGLRTGAYGPNRVPLGVVCAWARAVARQVGSETEVRTQWQEPLAFYPLRVRPAAGVFAFDRTIAIDAMTREMHVLKLHAPVLPEKR